MHGPRELAILFAAALMLSGCPFADDSDAADGFSGMCTAGTPCACPDGSAQTTACDASGATFCPCAVPSLMAGTGGVGGATGGVGGAAGVAGSSGVGGAAGAMAGVGGTGGMMAGAGGAGGVMAGAGGGLGGSGGSGAGGGGSGGDMMMSGAGGDGGDPGAGETGDVVGFTAAHNERRAMVDTSPPLPDLVWDDEVAAFAQGYADELADTCSRNLVHNNSDYGENLAAFFGRGSGGLIGSPDQVVSNWYNEVSCWTFGTINGTEVCDQACVSAMNSNGCGHYTQVVWRETQRVGCGVAACSDGGGSIEFWVCNYDPPGNWVGNVPY